MHLRRKGLSINYQEKQKAEFANHNLAFVCIDVQEKLWGVMAQKEQLQTNANKLIAGIAVLECPFIVCEQYPKALGATILELPSNFCDLETHFRIPKMSFSAFGEKTFCEALEQAQIQTLIIFGIESHICVRSSVIDALERGLSVVVVEDCCTSRLRDNHYRAMEELKMLGARILGYESVLFSFLLHAKENKFKALSQIIK